MWIDSLPENEKRVSVSDVDKMFDTLLLNRGNREAVILALDGMKGVARMQQMKEIMISSQEWIDALKNSFVS